MRTIELSWSIHLAVGFVIILLVLLTSERSMESMVAVGPGADGQRTRKRPVTRHIPDNGRLRGTKSRSPTSKSQHTKNVTYDPVLATLPLPNAIESDREIALAICSRMSGYGGEALFAVDSQIPNQTTLNWFCQCRRGLSSLGPGSVKNHDYGPWPAQRGWDLFPVSCGKIGQCHCVDKETGEVLIRPPMRFHHSPVPYTNVVPDVPSPVKIAPSIYELPGIDSLGTFGVVNGCIRLNPRSKIWENRPKYSACQLSGPETANTSYPMFGFVNVPYHPDSPVAPIMDDRFLYINVQAYYNSNPQHCLSDSILPILIDSYFPDRHGGSTSNAKYVIHGDPQGYCAETFHRLKLVGLAEQEEVDITDWKCFREIRIARRLAYRNLESTFGNKPIPWLPAAVREANRWIFSNATVFADLYNRAQRANHCRLGERRSNTKWVQPTEDYVLVYDRIGDTYRRHMQNSDEVAAALEQYFAGKLKVRLIHSINDFSVCEQAELFSHARVAVFPHGGHTSNVMYMPPGAKAIELFCGRPDELGALTTSAYAHLMGLEWTSIHEPQCTKETYKFGDFAQLSGFNATVQVIIDTLS